jgi:hypothetical protein
MYNKLPVKERIELMKSYRKANKDMSYRDMVKDYNDSYEKFRNGGINDDKNKNLTSEDNKQFLKNMSNSPLFAERYSKMTGSNNPLEVSKYKEDLNTNLNSVKLVDNDLILKYRKADAAYIPSYHTIYEKKEKDENRYPLNNLHELSHSSTKGELVFKNPYTYNPTEEYYKNEEMKKYLTQPTETKARVDVGRKLLLNNGQYDPINERFTEDGYEKLKLFGENNQNVQDLIKNYSKEDVIRMFNDITYNKNNNQLPIARYGGIQKFGDGGKKSFNDWYKTVPSNKADTSSYNLRRAYELAPQKDLDNFVKDPNAHLYSTYENKETGIYEFMKSKNHPTIQKELEWFNSNDPEAIKFRKNYKLDTSKDYYQYVPQKHKYGGIQKIDK